MRKVLLVFAILSCVARAVHAQNAATSASPAPAPGASAATAAPAQPISFDHKLHAQTAKMSCSDCHAPRGDGSTVAMPQAPKCMTCHVSVATDKPDIQRLASAAKNEDPIVWVRVYRVPSFVTFSHKTHADSKCEECHGPVQEQAAISLYKDTHMGTCIACHQTKQAPVGCDTCHAIQSKNSHSPFDLDKAMLARLQSAAAKPAMSVPMSPGSQRTSQQLDFLATFLHAPVLYTRAAVIHN